MDSAKRDALLALVGDLGARRDALPLVTLEAFFDGNDDKGSIWCNLLSSPEPSKVCEKLRSVRDRADVSDVRVLVTQYDGGQDEWPFSDSVYFITTATEEEIRLALGDEYAPDEIWTPPDFGNAEALAMPAGFHLVCAWWD